MTSPTTPMPPLVERWIRRSRYLRWIDALLAWLLLAGIVALMLPVPSGEIVALLSLGLLGLALLAPSLRLRWRPVSGWVGLAASATLRPGARAWFVREGRADVVLVTGRRGARLSITEPGRGEAETISVRRTRVFVVPFDEGDALR